MADCSAREGRNKTRGFNTTLYQCNLEEGHFGPHRIPEVPWQMQLRNQWEQANVSTAFVEPDPEHVAPIAYSGAPTASPPHSDVPLLSELQGTPRTASEALTDEVGRAHPGALTRHQQSLEQDLVSNAGAVSPERMRQIGADRFNETQGRHAAPEPIPADPHESRIAFAPRNPVSSLELGIRFISKAADGLPDALGLREIIEVLEEIASSAAHG